MSLRRNLYSGSAKATNSNALTAPTRAIPETLKKYFYNFMYFSRFSICSKTTYAGVRLGFGRMTYDWSNGVLVSQVLLARIYRIFSYLFIYHSYLPFSFALSSQLES
jgi:hypothetical protein